MTKQVLIYRNQNEIDSTISNFKTHSFRFQEVVRQFADLQIGEVETRTELLQAIKDPSGFIRMKLERRINEQPVVISGIPLKLEKVIDLLDAGEVSQFVASCRAAQMYGHFFERIGNINKQGEVFADEILIKSYTEYCSFYAKTEKQIAIFNSLQMLIQSVNELKKIGISIENTRIAEITKFDESKDRFVLRHEYFEKIA